MLVVFHGLSGSSYGIYLKACLGSPDGTGGEGKWEALRHQFQGLCHVEDYEQCPLQC